MEKKAEKDRTFVPYRRKCGRKNQIELPLLYALHIFAAAGVDTDDLALIDEHGHVDDGARLERGLLGDVGGRIALDARARTR